METTEQTTEAPVLDLSDPVPPHIKNEFFDEAAAALQSFKDHMTGFNKLLFNYPGSKKQLLSAWSNAALEPFHESPPTWSYPSEKEMFNHFNELESAKFILMVHGLADAGVLTLHKPLMMATPATESERQLKQQMESLTNGPEIDLGKRELPPIDQL